VVKLPAFKPEHYPLLIPVGKKQWHVVFYDKLLGGDLGYCCQDSKVIGISRDQPPEEMMNTFIHEMLHAVEFEMGIVVGHPKIRKIEAVLGPIFLKMLSVTTAR